MRMTIAAGAASLLCSAPLPPPARALEPEPGVVRLAASGDDEGAYGR